jgi:trk system potassium uptake protein TrkH
MPSRFQLSPPQLLAASILGLIAFGTGLLVLPVSSSTGSGLSVVDALFTSTSAVCVTGLIVVDTPTAFSPFGQGVLLLLIQAGGLGYMAITTIVGAALGKRITLQERLTLQEALNVHSIEGVVRFTFTVFKLTLAFELAGAAILALWWMGEFGPARAAWLGIFHSVSAFNNAGFSLFSTNLIGYRADFVVNAVMSGLIICGGLGFVALSEIGRARRTMALSLHTRFAILVTACLLVGGTIAIFALEMSNPRTLGAMSGSEAFLTAYFHSVSARTAGFNSIDIAALTNPSLFLLIVLMFIGASPGGTGGGVKTTTFGITVLALWATIRGADEPTIFRRRLPAPLVARAFFICLTSFLALNIVAGLLLASERVSLLEALFETTSAFGTVGLSTGVSGSVLSLSGHMTAVGKLLMIVMMFIGRVGPLGLAVALARGGARPRIRYPEGKILIG